MLNFIYSKTLLLNAVFSIKLKKYSIINFYISRFWANFEVMKKLHPNIRISQHIE